MIALAVLCFALVRQDLDGARTAYEAGRLVDAHERLVEAWDSGIYDRVALAIDLGHTCRELDRPTEAVLWYRRALAVGGEDAEVSAALHAIERDLGVASRAMPPRGPVLLHAFASVDDGIWCVSVFAVWSLCLAFLCFTRRRVLALACLVCALPGSIWLGARHVFPAPARAVVIADEVRVRATADGAASNVWALGGGEWVDVLEERATVLRIDHPRGTGWVERAALAPVDDE